MEAAGSAGAVVSAVCVAVGGVVGSSGGVSPRGHRIAAPATIRTAMIRMAEMIQAGLRSPARPSSGSRSVIGHVSPSPPSGGGSVPREERQQRRRAHDDEDTAEDVAQPADVTLSVAAAAGDEHDPENHHRDHRDAETDPLRDPDDRRERPRQLTRRRRVTIGERPHQAPVDDIAAAPYWMTMSAVADARTFFTELGTFCSVTSSTRQAGTHGTTQVRGTPPETTRCRSRSGRGNGFGWSATSTAPITTAPALSPAAHCWAARRSALSPCRFVLATRRT